nr:reverse transcriptase domain, reverse transcriptase zinc-binding domain protein [Tanacetum cinerariifolium]
MRRVNAWGHVVEKFKNGLAEWKAKSMSLGDRLTLIGWEIDGMRIEFSSSFRGVMGDGRDIRFWVDRDKWRWVLGKDGEFTVKELARLVEEMIPHVESGSHETLWNKLAPKKVNIFVWMALKGRLHVCVELDKKGIDLDSVLCCCCNNIMETCAHCLVTYDLAMSVWEKVFNWWKVGTVNSFSIDELFSSNGVVNVPIDQCEQCKGTHYTKEYPLKEEGKTLKKSYYTQFGRPFQGGGYGATALGFYHKNNPNPSYQSMEETLSKFMSESAKDMKKL